MDKTVSENTLKRLPTYLEYLQEANSRGETNTSARSIASALSLGEIQVRKDLAQVSDGGRPKIGYIISELTEDIKNFLGYNNVRNAVLVGAGKLGQALMSYGGFRAYGLNITAAFDLTPAPGVLPMDSLDSFIRENDIHIGIITVPAPAAQEVCDRLISCGILAIWNFAPAHIIAPDGILVKSENMASSLAVLSKHLEAAENASGGQGAALDPRPFEKGRSKLLN